MDETDVGSFFVVPEHRVQWATRCQHPAVPRPTIEHGIEGGHVAVERACRGPSNRGDLLAELFEQREHREPVSADDPCVEDRAPTQHRVDPPVGPLQSTDHRRALFDPPWLASYPQTSGACPQPVRVAHDLHVEQVSAEGATDLLVTSKPAVIDDKPLIIARHTLGDQGELEPHMGTLVAPHECRRQAVMKDPCVQPQALDTGEPVGEQGRIVRAVAPTTLWVSVSMEVPGEKYLRRLGFWHCAQSRSRSTA